MRDPTQTQTHAHAQTHAHTYTNTHSHTPIHTHTVTHTNSHASTRSHAHTYTYTLTQTLRTVPLCQRTNSVRKIYFAPYECYFAPCEWVRAHIWMNHRTRMKESWHTYERVMVPCLCTSAQTPQWKCYFAPPSSSPVPAYVCMRAHVWFLGYDLCENVLCLCAFVSANIIVDVRYQKYNIRYRVA